MPGPLCMFSHLSSQLSWVVGVITLVLQPANETSEIQLVTGRARLSDSKLHTSKDVAGCRHQPQDSTVSTSSEPLACTPISRPTLV